MDSCDIHVVLLWWSGDNKNAQAETSTDFVKKSAFSASWTTTRSNRITTLQHFRENGYVVLENALTPDEITRYTELFDRDRSEHGRPNLWHPFAHQMRNCNPLVTTPEFDELIRHPNIMPVIELLMGGPVCFSEICLRYMEPNDGETEQRFHRDRPHWVEHPLRMDYIQSVVYLTDLDETTHCFSISPESVDEPILDTEEQLERNGIFHFHAPAGTVALINIAVLHAATVRVTDKERKTVQTYYGHQSRPYLSNCSVIPPRFFRHHPDPQVRAFYGKLNKTTETFIAAFDPVES